MLKVIFAVAVFLLSTITLFALPQQTLVPGGIVVMEVDDYRPGTQVMFNKKRAALFEEDAKVYALAGISLDSKPGVYKLVVTDPLGKKRVAPLNIIEKKYDEQHLSIKNKRKVNPNQEDMARIGKERVRKQKAKTHWSETMPDVSFVWPIQGRISSIFGLRRFFNEQERSPHSGLDIAAPEGTSILAVADGVVLETGDFFFSGNMIFIDHGQGLVSYYAHLSRIDVKAGQRVKKGEHIGAVGETGRVTGPHLHFSVLINSVSVDPTYFLPEHAKVTPR